MSATLSERDTFAELNPTEKKEAQRRGTTTFRGCVSHVPSTTFANERFRTGGHHAVFASRFARTAKLQISIFVHIVPGSASGLIRVCHAY